MIPVNSAVAHRHPFEALAERAAKENWCWRLMCGTCGHMEFRRAFGKLAAGRHPDDPDWLKIGSGRGLEPGLPGWSKELQSQLLEIVSCADFGNVARLAPFPDWLGYVGLVLHHPQAAISANPAMCRQIAVQLRQFVQPDSPAWSVLGLVAEGQRQLRWQDLEEVERDYKRS